MRPVSTNRLKVEYKIDIQRSISDRHAEKVARNNAADLKGRSRFESGLFIMTSFIINSDKEYEERYHYDKKYIKEYPKTYPCILVKEYVDGGLCGDGYHHSIVYPPVEDLTTWHKGFEAGLKHCQ